MNDSTTPMPPPQTIEALMAQALTMEREAVARYSELRGV